MPEIVCNSMISAELQVNCYYLDYCQLLSGIIEILISNLNIEKWNLPGQNIGRRLYDPAKTDYDYTVDLPLIIDSFTDEHTNGKYWGWMNIMKMFTIGPGASNLYVYSQFIFNRLFSRKCTVVYF